MPDVNISELIQQSAKTYGKAPVQIMLCTVQSVNKSERTATVVPVTDNLSEFPAQLMSDVADGVLILPAKGSTVRVLLSELSTPTVIQYSEVDEVYIVTGGQLLRVYSSGIELDGTSFGGVMKVAPSVAAWNALQQDVNILKGIFAGLASAAPAILTSAVGSPDAFAAAFASAISTYASNTLQLTTRSQIENTKVKHGNGS